MQRYTPSIWALRNAQLHTRLDEGLIERLRQEGELERWGHHATIHHAPEELDVVMVLRGGARPRANMTNSPILRAGDLFGATEAGEGAGERLMAIDDTLLLSLPRARFEALAAEQLGARTGKPAGWRGPRVELPLVRLLYTTPETRVARLLAMLHEEHGEVREGGRWAPLHWDWPLEPSRLLGLTPSEFKQGLDALVRQEAIALHRRGVWLRDPAGLDALTR
jgi:CRP-like cAMP-binding protein